MAISFPYTFANLSGNVPASDLDTNFNYTTTLAANATVASSLTGSELILLAQGGVAYSATITQIVAAVGTGTATQANQLTTGRTFSVSGDATGTSTTFNGTANLTIPVTVTSATTSTAGKVQLAQASDVAAQVSNTLAVTPSSLASLPNGAKAFCRWAGQATNGTCSIIKTYNVSSVTRTAGGTYTITFTNALADANYTINVNCSLWSGGSMMVNQTYNNTPSTSSFSITSTDLSNTGRDVAYYSIVCFD